MKKFSILILKETRSGEKRVALLPDDVRKLIADGHAVFVEAGAGEGVNIADACYEDAGAIIRNTHDDFTALFKDIDLIVRVKRANHAREGQEIEALPENIVMIGALDPKETGSDHIDRYKLKKLNAYSIDYLDVPTDSPMNILAKMSTLTGQLALLDALEKHKNNVKKSVVIGYGSAGKAALKEALKQGIATTVFCTQEAQKEAIEQQGAQAIILEKNSQLEANQQSILSEIKNADIVITSARSRGVKAPLLIPAQSLSQMQAGAVIVDLSISDGGNVEGSEHDKTFATDQGVILTNVSAYPKRVPKQASLLWSQGSYLLIQKLSENDPLVASAKVT
jgi:H+-translocating NAD(P) transhydrogenase subunit alpha